ncbi:MAG: ATP-binding cassette domain-containing protein [Christensenellales bacterium]
MSKLIEIKDLSIELKGKEILRNANASFESGKVYLLDGKNGTGKSTLLKAILNLANSKAILGEILVNGSKNVFKMSNDELQQLRSSVAYLEQKDYYDQFYGVTVRDVLIDSYQDFLRRKLTKEDIWYVEDTFNRYVPADSALTLKKKVNKLSGGQQRLLSIISNICIRSNSNIFLIDEPLNNLDIENVINISNALNRIVKEKPDAVFLMVSHCKIFPFITNLATIVDGGIIITNDNLICNSCFGKANSEGYYEL